MRITIVSRSWPSDERSGVSLAAAEHVRVLVTLGHEVSIIGSNPTVLHEDVPALSRYYVRAEGFGSLYSPATVDRVELARAFTQGAPDLVVVEAWQTALTDTAVEVAAYAGHRVLMVSHGSSLHPFSKRPMDRLRALAWLPYRKRRLPRLLSCLSAMTTLDETAASDRFFDRDLALRMGVPVVPMINVPIHWTNRPMAREQRDPQVLVIGYFSSVKNQLAALEIAARLPDPLCLLFIGRRHGSYFQTCVQRAADLRLGDRVRFVEDHECDIAQEISRSIAVLSTSITEALPLTLIEAMACATPFVATPVGAVPSLEGGICAAGPSAQYDALVALMKDERLWNRYSCNGLMQFQHRYSHEQLERQMQRALEVALSKRSLMRGCD